MSLALVAHCLFPHCVVLAAQVAINSIMQIVLFAPLSLFYLKARLQQQTCTQMLA